ncbi:MAG: efflux RND transporter permease subunit, partial [Bifidobacteriaceae bacterium]|nr:efflux RND transporter permease subunit [Bifidobacteriaceae bacterium]
MRHRALIVLAAIALAALGARAAQRSAIELLPPLAPPSATVEAAYPDAPPAQVQRDLAFPIESALRSVPGVDRITSTCVRGRLTAHALLDDDADPSQVRLQISDALDRLAPDLPAAVTTGVTTGAPDLTPAIRLAVTESDHRAASAQPAGAEAAAALTQSAQRLILPALARVAGAGPAHITGAAPQLITIDLAPDRMAARGITLAQVQAVLRGYGLIAPAGQVEEGQRSLTVEAGAPLASLEDLASVPLPSSLPASDDGANPDADARPGESAPEGAAAAPAPSKALVRLGEIAEVVQGAAPATSIARFDGAPAVAIDLPAASGATPDAVAREVDRVLGELAPELEAEGIRVAVAHDSGRLAVASRDALARQGLVGLGLAFIVLLVCLVSFRRTVAALFAIAVSLAAALAALAGLGQTLNLAVLAALAVGLGRAAEASVAVVHAVSEGLANGQERAAAVAAALRLTARPVTASTACGLAALAPLALVGGSTGQLFRPFALALAAALVASLAVALLLAPVLAYWWAPASRRNRRGFWRRTYVPTLRGALRHPAIAIVLGIAILGGASFGLRAPATVYLGQTAADSVTVTQRFRPATALGARDAEARTVEERLTGIVGVRSVLTTLGEPEGADRAATQFRVTLDRGIDPTQALRDIRGALDGAGGRMTSSLAATADSPLRGGGAVELTVRAPSVDAVRLAAKMVEAAALAQPGAADPISSFPEDVPGFRVTVDADAAAGHGLTEAQVASAVAGLMAPQRLGAIDTESGPIDVQLSPVAQGAPAPTMPEITSMPLVRLPSGLLSVGAVATVQEVVEPPALTLMDGLPGATISLAPDTDDLGGLADALRRAVDGLDLPAGASVEVAG